MKKCCYFLFFLVTLLMVACGKDEQKKSTQNDASEPEVNNEQEELDLYEDRAVPQSADLNFEDFLFAFSTEQEFMNNRLASPLEIQQGERIKKVEKSEWKGSERFQNQDLYAFIYSNPEDVELLKNPGLNKVVILWTDLNTKTSDKYEFNIVDGKWNLVREVVGEQAEGKYAPFIEFYNKFVNDQNFQHTVVNDPVEIVITEQGEMEEGGTTMLPLKDWDDWFCQMPMPHNSIAIMDYGQSIDDAGNVNLLVRSIAENAVATYKFQRVKGLLTLTSVEF